MSDKALQHFYGKWQFDGETESSILCTEINREQRTMDILKIDHDGVFWLCAGNLSQLHDVYSQRVSKSTLTDFTQKLLKALNQHLPREYSYGKESEYDICLDKQMLVVRMRHEGGLTIDLVRLEFLKLDRSSMGSTVQRILSGFAHDASQTSNAVKDLERELSLKTADLASAQQQLQSQCNDKNSTSKLLLARFNLVLDTKKRYIRELEAEVAALKKGSEASGRNQRSSIVSSQSEDVDDVEPAAVKMNDAGPSAASLSKLSYISQTMSVDQRKQGNEAAVTSLSSLLQTDRDAPSTGAVTSVRKKIKLSNPSEALTTTTTSTTSTTSTSTTSAFNPSATSTNSSQSSSAALPRRTTRTSSNSGSADFMLRHGVE